MPELPEVETVVRGLKRLIIGKVIKNATSDSPKSFPNSLADVESFLIGAKITAVRRRAKVLMIDLDNDYSLVIHLKMTGQLVFVRMSSRTGEWSATEHPAPPFSDRDTLAVKNGSLAGERRSLSEKVELDAPERFGAGHPSSSLVGNLPDRSTRVTLTFADDSHLYFNDQRKFGWMKLLPSVEIPNIDFMKKVGPEPLESDFTPRQFARRFTRRPKTSIKAALLDQTVIAGVGNIYADESLWGAKIHPQRLVNTITPDEFHRLYTELRAVMNLAIEKGGSTDKNYVNAEGKRGSYLSFARVFRREGKACPRCGTTIIKFKAAGRGTHICPHCQKV
jgi:formamidopyrimidine-DNA glycosylase